ncbi:unnamed protein product [Paramecium pentaurelia]|uniref:PH domain-containing protein n=1 Tax=Paramecium pentaurelia TaxID=43138 RepID=A0A8S1ULJ8_9CILI|nr:unnamed protein product [Paramecium pentaurelia]
MSILFEEQLLSHNKEIEISMKILLQLEEYTEQENIMQIARLLLSQSQIIKEQQNALSEVENLCKDLQEQIDNLCNHKQQLIIENHKYSSQIYELQNNYNSIQKELDSEKYHSQDLSQLESHIKTLQLELDSLNNHNAQLMTENKRLNENNQQLLKIIDDHEVLIQRMSNDQKQLDFFKQEVQNQIHNNKKMAQSHDILVEQMKQKIAEYELKLDFFQQQQQSTLQSRMSFSLVDDLVNQEDLYQKVNETIQSEFQSIIQNTDNTETNNTEQVDEFTYFKKEYCGLKDNRYIKEIIKKDRESIKKQYIFCFSDYIFRINIRGEKSKRIMFITESTFYFFEEHNQNIKITRQFPISKVQQLICCEFNPILCCLKIKGQNDDYLIETFKLKDFIEFLNETLNSQIQISYQQNFQIQFKNYTHPKNLNEIGNGLYDGSGKQAAFKVSQKQGFLQMQQKTLFGFQDWVEVFALMTDVGLLLFKQAGDMHPILFVPCADAIIIKNPLKCKPNCLKIKYRDCEYVFNVTSQALLEEWFQELNKQVVSQHKLQLSQSLRNL